MADDKRKYDASTVFNANFQVGKAAPLDNRDVVRRYAHLVEGIGLNHYMGQVVYVTGEYDSTKDNDNPAPQTVNGIVESEVGFYYFKNETEGWVKKLTIVDGGSGGGGGTTIPVDVLPVDEPNGVAPLDENGLVPSGNLPSYVDDVIEGYGYMEGTDPDKYLVFYKKQIINGYYYNGAFYEDDEHTTEITPSDDKYYYDLTGSALYYYDAENTEYVAFYEYEVIDGYYYNGAFYSDAEHTTAITPAANKYYRSLVNSLVYYYDTENSEYKLVADEDAPFIVGGKSKIYVDLLTEKTYRWSGTIYTEISGTQVSKSFTTNIAVGGVPVGTTIDSTMSLEDVLKKILVNVYQPRVTTNASAAIAKGASSAADVVKIGVKSIDYNWSISGNQGTVKRNNGTSDETLGTYAGAMSAFKLYHTANSTDTLLKSVSASSSPQTITLSVNSSGYFQIDNTNIEIGGNTVQTSSEQTLTFKGGVVFGNGTKYKDSTGADSTLAAFVGQELKSTSNKTIEIVCPVFANTDSSTPTVSVEQTNPTSKTILKSYSGFDVNNPDNGSHGLALTLQKHKLVKSGGSVDWNNSTPYTIEIPHSWTLYKVFWYNSNAKVWEDNTSLFVSKETANKTVNGVTVSYDTYYYNVESGNIDANKFVIFIS